MNTQNGGGETISVKFKEKEFELLRGTFKDNAGLLKVIRKSLLQQEMQEVDEEILAEHIKGKELKELLQKIFLPSLEDDVNIEWISESLFNIGGQLAPLQVRTVENGAVAIQARLKAISYCQQELDNLFDRGESPLQLKDLEAPKEDRELYINYVAREEIVEKVKNFLKEIRLLSSGKSMTPEEMAEAARKDSSK